MPKFIDEVLSEIVGVPCGDITFFLCVESVGQTLGGLLRKCYPEKHYRVQG